MQIGVGDLVRAKHWEIGFFGLVVAVRNRHICSVMLNGDDNYKIDKLTKDLEVICK